jgi:hypothetical protein
VPLRKVSNREALFWLKNASRDAESPTGFDVAGWESSVWILHAMYEVDDPSREPGSYTYTEPFPGASRPLDNAGIDAFEKYFLSSGPRTPPEGPGAGWRRLTWRENAERFGTTLQRLYEEHGPPSGGWFTYSPFWPDELLPPEEGSLDREQFLCLLSHLAAVSSAGWEAQCATLYSTAMVVDDPLVQVGNLRDVLHSFDDPNVLGTPSNFWPDDHSWFVYTDWDLSGTRVSGSKDLVARLRSSSELETVSL